MAFPTLRNGAPTGSNGSFILGSTGWAPTLPPNAVAGDLVLAAVIAASDTINISNFTGTGWQLASDFGWASYPQNARLFKLENATLPLPALTVSGWTGTANINALTYAYEKGVLAGTAPAQATSQYPDPPNLSPGSAKDYTWLCWAARGGVAFYPSEGPSGYTLDEYARTAGLDSGRRNLNAASENPGTGFRMPSSYGWGALTAAVFKKPSAGNFMMMF